MRSKKIVPRKRFAQHFLRDMTIIELIVDRADPKRGEHVLEIGPGEGALTSRLLRTEAAITALEIDRDLADGLRKKYQGKDNFRLVEGDILKCDWMKLVEKDRENKIVANLPYNISTPLLFKLIGYRKLFKSVTVMLQKEVALRLCHSGKGKKLKEYGILSVIFGNLFDIELLTDVPPGSFYPRPKVFSSVIQLRPLEVDMPDEKKFSDFVRRAFNHRRKLFLNHLKKNEPALYSSLLPETISALKNLRPENLKPDQYLRLFLEKRI